MKIRIPARSNAPETHLNVKIVSQNENQLGKKPILFILPGGPGAPIEFYKSYECLSEVADLVFHDPRGCGSSDKADPNTYTMENYLQDVEEIRKALQLNKINILGKSYGSCCAMAYALEKQQYIDKLILAAGTPSYRFIELAKRNLQKWGTKEQQDATVDAFAGNFQSQQHIKQFFKITAPLYSVMARTKPPKEIECDFNYEATNLGFKTFLRTFDIESELHKIKLATLILAGKQDWINDVSLLELVAERIPDSRLITFANASHAMEVDVKEDYFSAIKNFLLEA